MTNNTTHSEHNNPSYNNISRNKELIFKITSEGWSPDILKKVCAPYYKMHYGQITLDLDNLIEFMGSIHNALPDLRFRVEDMLAERDKVVTRWIACGTHQKAFQGAFPTHEPVIFTGITISRVKNGKIVEDWEEVDQLNFTQQFGAFPKTL